MADLEQAIADKCAHFLQPHKNVLSAAEIEDVLKQMGPVETDGAQPSQSSAANEQPRAQTSHWDTPRRLYQIREGAMLSGVCTGIAAYFNVDVTIVRILFVVLALLTGGIWILVYIAMMLVIPFANTDEEHAAAAGAPFNAQEVIDRAKKHYGEFKNSKEWRRHWRQQRREWRRRWHDGAYWWAHNLQRNVHQFSAHPAYGAQLVAGLLIPFLAILSTVVFCLWIVAVVQLASSGMIFGWAVPASIPLWVSILILIFIYSAISRTAASCAPRDLLQYRRLQLFLVRRLGWITGTRRAGADLLVRLHPSAAGTRVLSSTSTKTGKRCGTTSSIHFAAPDRDWPGPHCGVCLDPRAA